MPESNHEIHVQKQKKKSSIKFPTHVKINLKSFENIPPASIVSSAASQNILKMHARPSKPCLCAMEN